MGVGVQSYQLPCRLYIAKLGCDIRQVSGSSKKVAGRIFWGLRKLKKSLDPKPSTVIGSMCNLRRDGTSSIQACPSHMKCIYSRLLNGDSRHPSPF